MALVIGGIGEGHRTVVVGAWFSCHQGNMIDADNSLINVAPALAAEAESSGLGGFEGVARPVGLYLFRNRFDLDEDRRCGIDPDCAKWQWFTDVPRGIPQSQFTVAVLSVAGKADKDFRFALIHMLEITTAVAGVDQTAYFTGFYLQLYAPAFNPKFPDLIQLRYSKIRPE